MVLLNTTSFSAVASANFPTSTFTSTYDSYYVEARYTATGLSSMRVRAAGVNASGATDYKFQFNGVYGTGTRLDSGSTGASSIDYFGNVNSGTQIVYVQFWINGISTATPTVGNIACLYNDGTNRHARQGNMWHDLSTAYDSLALINTGTMTGSMTAYGVNK